MTQALRWREQVFLRFCCKDPVTFQQTKDELTKPPELITPLDRLSRVFDSRLERAIQNAVVVDIGCGTGDQVIGVLRAGARSAIGIDVKPEYTDVGRARARELGLSAQFLVSTADVPADSADVIVTQNAFEHFRDPASILADSARMLRPEGLCFVTFGPPWWHPFGEHFYFMIRPDRPWMHAVFSERTILTVRRLYLPNAPLTWMECGLNQMTIRKFTRLISQSRLTLVELKLTAIHGVPRWLHRSFPEITTAHVSAILKKTVRP